jgi:hypothetical protein
MLHAADGLMYLAKQAGKDALWLEVFREGADADEAAGRSGLGNPRQRTHPV